MLAEAGRTPFDFQEAERELISGYNVERGGPLFTLTFLAEYGSLISMGVLGGRILFDNRMVGAALLSI